MTAPLTLTDWLDTQQTAELLRLSPLTLSRWRKAGKGPRCARVGRRYLYDRADVNTWLEQQKTPQASP
jgi:excisionase family DNA binding protein